MTKKNLPKILPLAVCALVLFAVQNQCNTRQHTETGREEIPHARPSSAISSRNAVPIPLMASPVSGEVILQREGYTCSYNAETRQPNYVSWALTPYRLDGSTRRSNNFSEDPDLGDGQRARLDDYKNSGYSRGHMCPAADNKWSKTAMEQSFYLSNVCPQTQTLNGGDWEELESACRNRVRTHSSTLYIVCGPLFENRRHRRLNKRIPVPEKFFKAILCLDKGKEKGVAFIYSNNTETHPMTYYACSIDSVEALTGYDLFHSVPQPLQDSLEASATLNLWP